jgi:class 3 adenylate cyclase/tetratricopeptide (TPR) repeat protein
MAGHGEIAQNGLMFVTPVAESTLSASALTPFVPRLVSEGGRHEPWWIEEGTLVFADVSGFTKLSEKLAELGKAGAEELTAILNGTFRSLLGVAVEDGGDLLKFGGDALLLLFNGDDHAARACRAAHRMRAALRARGPVVTGKGRVNLRISMGAHSGPFHLFVVGQTQRELIVTGAHATTVTEMESTADAGEIVISRSTAELLPPACVGQPKGDGLRLRRCPPGEPHRPPGAHGDPIDLTAFVPAAIRRRAESGSVEAEHRHVTVGFVHFGHADAVLDEQGADALHAQLEHLVEAGALAAAETGVCLISTDIAGDGGKLIFTAGAPDGVEDGEGRMLSTARSLLDAGVELPLSIGVHSGHVFAGPVGADDRRVYTVMGDAVNLAARLMAKAEHGQLVASRSAMEHSATPFALEPLEPFMVKGKRHPQEAFVVGERLEGRGRSALATTSFVGRERELAALRGAVESAANDAGAWIELVGDAGIGKSRLIQEALNDTHGLRVIRVMGEPFQADRPYFTSRLVLRAALGIPIEADPDDAGRQLQQRVTELAPELERWLPLLGLAIDATTEPTDDVDQTDPAFRPVVLRQTSIALLQAALVDGAILVFEDASWMDEASALLLAEAAGGLSLGPWLAITSTRGGATGLHSGLGPGATRIELSPLDSELAIELAKSATESAPIPDHDLLVLVERAAGNPLYLMELVEARRQAGSVDELPTTLEDLVTARMDALAPADRRLLRYASVLGERFSPTILAKALTGVMPSPSPAVWDRLEEFVEREQDDLRFRHDVVRLVAYEGLAYARRRELHSRVARTLADRRGPIDDDRLALLAMHFDRAHEYAEAWRYGRQAGQRAQETYANVEATARYERAIENGRRAEAPALELAEVAEALGDAAELAGRFDQAGRGYRMARRLHGPDAAQPRLMRKEGVLRERRGQFDAAERWFKRGLSAARQTSDAEGSREAPHLAVGVAGARYRRHDVRGCIRWSQRALDEAERIGDRRTEAHACYLLDAALSDLGDTETASEYRWRALPIFEELDDFVGQANVLGNLGANIYQEGDWVGAAEWFEKSRTARRRSGDVVGLANASHNLGEVRSDQGRLEEAEGLLREARRIWRASDYPMGVAGASSGLGRTLGRLGSIDEGLELLVSSSATFEELGIDAWVRESAARRADVLALGGRFDEAADVARQWLPECPPDEAATAILRRIEAICIGVNGDHTAAAEALRDSARIAQTAGSDYDHALALAELARLPDRDATERATDSATATAIAERLGVDLSKVLPAVPWSSSPEHSSSSD